MFYHRAKDDDQCTFCTFSAFERSKTFKLCKLEAIRLICVVQGDASSASPFVGRFFILSLLLFMCRQSGECEAQLSYLACHLSPNHLKHQSLAKDSPLSSLSLLFFVSRLSFAPFVASVSWISDKNRHLSGGTQCCKKGSRVLLFRCLSNSTHLLRGVHLLSAALSESRERRLNRRQKTSSLSLAGSEPGAQTASLMHPLTRRQPGVPAAAAACMCTHTHTHVQMGSHTHSSECHCVANSCIRQPLCFCLSKLEAPPAQLHFQFLLHSFPIVYVYLLPCLPKISCFPAPILLEIL